MNGRRRARGCVRARTYHSPDRVAIVCAGGRDRRGHRGCSVAYHLTRLGWSGWCSSTKARFPTRAARRGMPPTSSSRSTTRAGDAVDAGKRPAVRRARGVHRERRHRGCPQRRAPRGAPAPARLGGLMGSRAGVARDPGGGERARPLRRGVGARRWLLHALGRCRRFAAGGDDHARARPRRRHARRFREHRDPRARRRARTDPAGSHDTRRDRDGDGSDRLRCLEPAGRPARRCVDPAHPGGAPDDRGRPGAAVCRCLDGHRVSDHSRHGRRNVRAATWNRAADRLLRTPPDPREPDEIPSGEEASPSPTERPFTRDDFEPQLQHARELVPEILGDERSASGTRSTACSRSPRTASRSSARRPRCTASGRRRRSGSRRGRVSARRWPSG